MLIELLLLLIAGSPALPQVGPPFCIEYESCASQCEAGQGEACRELGRFHLGWSSLINMTDSNRRWIGDAALASTYLEQGCDRGDADSCLDRLKGQSFMVDSSMFRERWQPRPNTSLPDLAFDEVLELATRACELAPGSACHDAGNLAGRIRSEDWGDRINDPRAQFVFRMNRSMPFYERGCQAGDSKGCTRAAAWLITAALNMEMDINWQEAERFSTLACEAGEREACENWHDILNLPDVGPYDPAVARAMRLILCLNPRPCDPEDEYFNFSPEVIAQNRAFLDSFAAE